MTIQKAIITILLIISLFPTSLFAGGLNSNAYKAAAKAAAAGDYAAAFAGYEALAKEANPLAMFSLGLMLKNGEGCTKDEAKACEWFKKAADQNIPYAMHLYAECLQNGSLGTPDPAQAATWYMKAAEFGIHNSLCHMAELHMMGEGVKKDPAKAIELCEMALKKGSPVALITLGKFYLEGDPSVRDLQKAATYFEQGADYNLPEAQFYLGWLLALYSTKDLSLDARNWFEKAATQGFVKAYAPTGKLYYNAPVDPATGLPTETNLAKAYLWLSAASRASQDEKERQAAEDMLADIFKIMPENWIDDLNGKVKAHLAKYP